MARDFFMQLFPLVTTLRPHGHLLFLLRVILNKVSILASDCQKDDSDERLLESSGSASNVDLPRCLPPFRFFGEHTCL